MVFRREGGRGWLIRRRLRGFWDIMRRGNRGHVLLLGSVGRDAVLRLFLRFIIRWFA